MLYPSRTVGKLPGSSNEPYTTTKYIQEKFKIGYRKVCNENTAAHLSSKKSVYKVNVVDIRVHATAIFGQPH